MSAGFLALPCMEAAGSRRQTRMRDCLSLADECKIHLSRFQRWFLSNFKSPRYILTPAINILTWRELRHGSA